MKETSFGKQHHFLNQSFNLVLLRFPAPSSWSDGSGGGGAVVYFPILDIQVCATVQGMIKDKVRKSLSF